MLLPNYFEDCDLCIDRVIDGLSNIDGISDVRIQQDRKTIEITYDKEEITFEELREKARILGVEISEKYSHKSFNVIGLDCPDCALKLEKAIKKIKGVAFASFNYATSVLIIEYEPGICRIDDIISRIHSLGYDTEEKIAEEKVPKKARQYREIKMMLTSISGFLLILGAILILFDFNHTIANVLFLISAFFGGVFAARTGLMGLIGKSIDTNFLMTSAAVGAIILGEYSEAATVMFLFSLGSTLEAHTVEKARKSIKSLLDAFPKTATVLRENKAELIPINLIEVGDIVLVKPGERIAVDGIIIQGESSVNEASVTGESIPKEKRVGDKVYAGTLNELGSMQVVTSNSYEDNTLSRIIHSVEEAQAQKSPSQRFSEKFGRIYTPIIILLAAIIAILGPIVTNIPASEWFGRSLVLLVVSCPCALVISTPVAIVSAIANGARNGILIKGGTYLETLGNVNVAAFDKTGTLTEGKLRICEIIAFSPYTDRDILSFAAAVECRSEHPIASAICEAARDNVLNEHKVSFFEAFPGKGAVHGTEAVRAATRLGRGRGRAPRRTARA